MEQKVKWWSDMSGQMFKKHQSDAGFDIRSSESIIINAGASALVHTGLHVAIPKGYVGILKARSSVASKCGVSVDAGVIDADYRGEIQVLIRVAPGSRVFCPPPFSIDVGQRIAQLVVVPCLLESEQVESLDDLDKTQRGIGGFGSTDMEG